MALDDVDVGVDVGDDVDGDDNEERESQSVFRLLKAA